MRQLPLLLLLSAAACAKPGGPYPSLQPRAAEAIDPRLPVVRAANERPAAAGLTAQLSRLVERAHDGTATFDRAADQAERLAAGAGARGSEGWIAAQEALTVAIAARGPATGAIGDIDQIAAVALQTKGGIAPGDFAAIKRAADEVSAINERQAARIAAVQRRLSS